MEKLLEAYNGRLEKLGEEAKATKETKILLEQVFSALKDSGKQPRIEDLSAKHVDRYLKEKTMRRKLWQKASNYLAFKEKLYSSQSPLPTMFSNRDFAGSSVGNVIALLE